MQTIIPAVIPLSLAKLKETIELVGAFAGEVQIDIVDGKFVPFTSWPYGEDDQVFDICIHTHDVALEFDLMLVRPEAVIDTYIGVGAKRIVIHLESTDNIDAIINHQNRDKFSLGLSILNTTPLEKLFELIPQADYIQLMGIGDIGSQGQPFDERVLPRIKELRAAFPKLLISIDGSVNRETLPRLKEAGANRFVSGSAILHARDPESAFTELVKLSL